MRPLRLISLTVAGLIAVSVMACVPVSSQSSPTRVPVVIKQTQVPVSGKEPTPTVLVSLEDSLEDFDPDNFDDPTNIDNAWLPMQPGMQYIYEGTTEEAGLIIPHRLIITYTDLVKEISGVRALVSWDQDFSADQLVETELAFFAQDNDGNVWRLGEYPEVYEDGKLAEIPTWFHGLAGASAGIIMPADPQLGGPSYSQGWAPAVNFTDRGQVDQIGVQTCVAFDCYEDVMIVAEFSREEPDAFQLKYYASGVGNVQVGWRGADATKETLELVIVAQLNGEAMKEVRARALELEQRAYENSKDVYSQTEPSE